MRIEGDKIVDVSASDAKDLRAYLTTVPYGLDAGFSSAKTYDLWHQWQAAHPGRRLHDARLVFLAMVALALVDGPNGAQRTNVEPYRGILSGLTTLPKPTPGTNFAVTMLYERLWTILGETWPEEGAYHVARKPTQQGPSVTSSVPHLSWAIEQLLESYSGAVGYDGHTVATKSGALVRTIEADDETHAWDLDHFDLGDMYAPQPSASKYTFASGRALWDCLSKTHSVNANYYVNSQKFDSLLGACEFFWTLVHTRSTESHSLYAVRGDKIQVASHENGRTKVMSLEDAAIPVEVCV